MALNELAVFVAVVEEKSFSQAAEKLYMSPSRVSRQITNLEKQLGVKLLHRTTRNLALTEAGAQYFERAQTALFYARAAEEAAAAHQKTPRGTLRVHAPMSFGKLHLTRLIPPFLDRYKDLKVDLTLNDTAPDLIASGIDLSLWTGALHQSNQIARRIADLGSALCVTPAYAHDRGLPQTPEELTEHNCIIYDHPEARDVWVFARSGAVHEIPVSGNYRVNNGEAVRDAVLAGLGIARLPQFIANPFFRSGVLVQALAEYEMPTKTLYAVYPDREFLPVKIRVFLDYLVENLT